jgi:hypothetical protein
MKCSSGVTKIASGKTAATLQRFGGTADEHAIHDDIATGWEIRRDKLVLSRNISEQYIFAARKLYGFALAQVGQGHESVVFRIEPQHAAL